MVPAPKLRPMNTPNSSCKPVPQRARRSQRGFTLIELAIVLAVASVVAGTAVPAFADYVRTARVKSATSDLFSALLLARGEALRSNVRVVVCKSADGDTCAGGGGWEQGWIMFQDANGNAVREADEAVVLRGPPMPGGVRATGNGSVARYVSYAPEGVTKLAGGGFQAGTLTVCLAAANADEAREIIINSTGRPRVQKTRVSACI